MDEHPIRPVTVSHTVCFGITRAALKAIYSVMFSGVKKQSPQQD